MPASFNCVGIVASFSSQKTPLFVTRTWRLFGPNSDGSIPRVSLIQVESMANRSIPSVSIYRTLSTLIIP